jgi:hypothetical protein
MTAQHPVAILLTNYKDNTDDAFMCRIIAYLKFKNATFAMPRTTSAVTSTCKTNSQVLNVEQCVVRLHECVTLHVVMSALWCVR